MTRVLVDEMLMKKLHNLAEPLEFFDSAGRILGKYLPRAAENEEGPFEPQVSDEELTRRYQNPGKCYTTTEVLEYLRKL